MIFTKKITNKPLHIIKCIGFLIMIQYPISVYRLTSHAKQHSSEFHLLETDGLFWSVLLIFTLGSICYFGKWVWSYLVSAILMWFNVQNFHDYRENFDYRNGCSCIGERTASEGEKLLESALQAGELASKVAIATMLLAFLVGVIGFVKEVINKKLQG